VNTVKNVNGEFYGYNTDAVGFLRSLDSAGIALRGRVLLCGAGGAARMMACEVLERGCRLVIATRESKSAEATKADLDAIFTGAQIEATTLEAACGSFDLLINATPAGMYPNLDGCPVAARVIEKTAAVFDAVYNPEETVLVRSARASGAKVVGGLDMLIGQAVAAQEIWTGASFAPDTLRPLHEKLTAQLAAHNFGKTGKRE
jgi:shikimate dehydrogenase